MDNDTVNESLLVNNVTEVTTTAAPANDSMMFYLEMFWYFAISMIGLVLYIIFYAVFIKYYETHFSKHAFYVLIQHLSIFDFIFLAYHVFLWVPTKIFHRFIFGDAMQFPMSMLVTGAFMGVVNTTALICFNRVLVFLLPKVNSIFFERPRIYGTVILLYVITIADVLIYYLVFGCHDVYFSESNSFAMLCTDWGTAFQQFMLHPSYLGGLITALYLLLCIYVFALGKQHNSNNQQRRELRILAQGSIIGITLLVANLTFVLAPNAHFTQKTFSLVNSAMNPALYITFNSVVRRQLASCGSANDTKTTRAGSQTAGKAAAGTQK